MFYAVNAITNERLSSITLEDNSSHPFPHEEKWYAEPNEIESCPKEIDIQKIQVRFREGSTDNISSLGNKFDIAPHFYIPNKEKLGINVVPESKEHKLAKNWIYSQLKNKNLKINYSTITKPFKYKNSINLFDLPIDKQKIGIEVSYSSINGSRRADVICPFLINHPFFGNGIVFEIQFSNMYEKTKIDRELDWSVNGYSIAWLHKSDFDQLNENNIVLKKDSVDVDSFSKLIKKNNKTFIRNLKYTIAEECRKLDLKKANIINDLEDYIEKVNNKNNEKITYSKQSQLNSQLNDTPVCPKCDIFGVLRNGTNGLFWGCSSYPKCKWSRNYDG